MSSGLLRKAAIVVIILLACMQVVGLFYALGNSKAVERRVVTVYQHENSLDILRQEIADDYSLQQFLKDTYVNASLCKDEILLVILLMFIMDAIVLFYFFKTRKTISKS